MKPFLKRSRPRWPFQRRTAAWLPTLTLCLLGGVLTVQAQDPSITNPNHPMDTNVSAGATVSLMAYVSTAKNPLTYQWMHDGTNLTVNMSVLLGVVTMTLSNLTVADGGSYVLWITNNIGGYTNTRTAILTIDPTFTKITTGAIVTDSEGSIAGNWADYDNDGYPDLFVANSSLSGSVRNTLYHNIGGTNFSRVATSPFTNDPMRSWSAAWADYDNDGNVDLIAGSLDGSSLYSQRLYCNDGSGSFTAVVDSELRSDAAGSTCQSWIDYDNDGFLDLFVTKGWSGVAVANDCLFRNNGDGTFKKMAAAQVGPMINDQLRTEFSYSVDYDNDGRQELSVIYNTSSGYTNSIWRCQANGTFVPTTTIGMPNSFPWRWWADYDNDGWLDAITQNAGAQAFLFRNLGTGGFTNVTAALNMTKPILENWVAWGDYDNDGWLDLFYTGAYWNSAGTFNGLFHNNGDGAFTQILAGSPVYDLGRRIVPSWTDYNNDGFLDLFIAVGDAMPERNLLYRNNGNTNHWLKVKLEGRASNRSGIGARVRVNATICGTNFWQMREIACENGMTGQNGLLAHFGLGDATNVTTLEIKWPSGIVQELTNVAANQFLTVTECQGYVGAAPQFSGAATSSGGLQLSLTEPLTDARYILEASTDLVHWTKLMARTSVGGTTNYTDTRATNYASRYYRLQVP